MGAARWIRFAVLMSFAALFLWLFYARYWRHRDCIAASCGATEGHNLVSMGAFWIVPALLFALFALTTLKRS